MNECFFAVDDVEAGGRLCVGKQACARQGVDREQAAWGGTDGYDAEKLNV